VKVLVAGGAGFIGSHVCRTLLYEGHEVICLDNYITGRPTNIEALLDNPSFRFIEADVSQDMPPLDPELILHLASPASPIHYKEHSIETMLVNSMGTMHLLQLATDVGARFLYASTSEVYGDPLEHPQTEGYWGNVNPIGPRACYDESKRFGEAMTFEYRRKFQTNASLIRIFNTYGERMNLADGRVVPAFVAAALNNEPLPVHGSGTQTRSFCYVSDLVQAMLLIAFDRDADGEVFNIGNPYEITMLQLADEVVRATGSTRGIEFTTRGADDPERRKPDISKVKGRYGWEPVVGLSEGIGKTVEYFKGTLTGATN
jgi:nucleoside-diphosphate-sugar epimerase